MIDPVRNFARATVSAGYDAAATSITLSSGDGALFPAPATEGAFNAVWWNYTDFANPSDQHRAFLAGSETEDAEVVRIGARSTDTLSSLVRGQEGTTATTHNKAGKTYRLALDPTKKLVDDLRSALQVQAFENFI